MFVTTDQDKKNQKLINLHMISVTSYASIFIWAPFKKISRRCCSCSCCGCCSCRSCFNARKTSDCIFANFFPRTFYIIFETFINVWANLSGFIEILKSCFTETVIASIGILTVSGFIMTAVLGFTFICVLKWIFIIHISLYIILNPYAIARASSF